MTGQVKIILLALLAMLLSGHVQKAYAEDCSIYPPNSEPYFSCALGASAPRFRNNCKPVSVNGTDTIKLMSHEEPYTAGTTPRFVGLVKDGTSLTCPTNQPGNASYWQIGSPYEGKIVLNYSPCTGALTANSGFIDGIDCSPTGKAADANDDLESHSTRKPAISLSLANGECKKAYNMTFCAELHTPYICAYVPNGTNKIYIGCYDITPTSASIPPPSLACFIPNLCWDKDALIGVSRNPTQFSISGAIVLCAEGAIDKVFFSGWDSTTNSKMSYYGPFGDKNNVACPAVSMFYKVQQSLRAAALAAITLWVVLWGMKVTLGGVTSKGEFIKNVVTVALVVYFCLGSGWTEYLPILRQLMAGLSQAMILAVSNDDPSTMCSYSMSDYPHGFETMALWDTLDCKLITYFFSEAAFPKLLGIAVLSVTTMFIYGLFILALIIIFAAFLLGTLIFAVEMYIVALVIIAFLVFLSPIFIPMALFNITRGYFKSWLGELISASLYPVLLFAYIALMLAVFDQFYFGDCHSDTFTSACVDIPFPIWGSTMPAMPDSAGMMVHASVLDWDSYKVSSLRFDLFILALLKICIAALVFHRFFMILTAFLAELGGGQARSNPEGMTSGTGQKVMGKGARAVKASVNIAAGTIKGAITGGKVGAIKGAAMAAGKEAQENKKEDERVDARTQGDQSKKDVSTQKTD